MGRLWIYICCFCMGCMGCESDKKAAPPAIKPSVAAGTSPNPVSSTSVPLDTSSQAPAPSDKKAAPIASGGDTRSVPLPPPSAKRPPGEVAYVTQERAVLLEQPRGNAAKIPVHFKRSDPIYILERKMTDEAGKEYDIPQWYKVQCESGQKGWMRANFVGLPF